MPKHLFTIFFCLFLGGTLWAQEPDRKPAKYAVLVGVNDYVRLTKLRYAKKDIEALRDELVKIGFTKVYCLTSGAAEEKNKATKENIEFVIERVLEIAKHGDTVIIAMSGHGVEVGGQARFCPPDTQVDDLEGTTVAVGDIFTKFEKSKATFKLMLVDACRDNPFRSRNVEGANSLGTLDDPPKGVMLFQSCAKGELSYEDSDLERGVFTHYLVEGLRGEAANKKGKITLLGLTSYAIDETQRHALDQFRSRQQPYLKGEITDFVLVEKGAIVVPEPVVVPPKPKPSKPSKPEPVEPESVESEMESVEPEVVEPEVVVENETVNYRLNLSQVTLGDMPPGWNGPNNAMVGNVGGSKCITSSTDKSAEFTLTDLFKQSGDFVLSITCIAYSGNGASGTIRDENGNTISFGMVPSNGRVSFGDAPGKSYQARGRTDYFYSNTYTITRKGNILSMTCEGLGGEAITMRSDTFKSLTGFTITIPSTKVGISQFSVRSLDGTPRKQPTKDYTLNLAPVELGNPPPKGWHGLDNAVVNNVGGSKCVTTSSDRNPVELVLTDLFSQPGDFVLSITCIAYSGNGASGTIRDENGNTISFGMVPSRGWVSFGDAPGKSYQASGNRDHFYSNTYTITRKGNILSMTCDGLAGDVIVQRSDTFKSLTGFTVTIPITKVGISQFSVRSLGGSEAAVGGEARSSHTSQGATSTQKPKPETKRR